MHGDAMRTPLARHRCRCGCAKTRRRCRWRIRHKAYLAEHREEIRELSLPEQEGMARVQSSFRSPRVRHMIEVLMRLDASIASDPKFVLDTSQSIHLTGARRDGHIPTLTTQSALFVPALGRDLTVAELCCLMGADAHVEEARSLVQANSPVARHLKRMLGNSMHVAVVGSICAFALAAAGSE